MAPLNYKQIKTKKFYAAVSKPLPTGIPNILNSDKLLKCTNRRIITCQSQNLSVLIPSKFVGKMVKSSHYRLVTPKFSIDLWYSPKREWLALKSKTESGASIALPVAVNRNHHDA